MVAEAPYIFVAIHSKVLGQCSHHAPFSCVLFSYVLFSCTLFSCALFSCVLFSCVHFSCMPFSCVLFSCMSFSCMPFSYVLFPCMSFSYVPFSCMPFSCVLFPLLFLGSRRPCPGGIPFLKLPVHPFKLIRNQLCQKGMPSVIGMQPVRRYLFL